MPDDKKQYVKLPDGSYAAFPASMKDADITAAIQKNFPTDPLVTGKGMEDRAHEQARPERSTDSPITKAAKLKENQARGATNELTGVPETPEEAAQDAMISSTALGLVEGGMGGVPGLLKFGRGVVGGLGGAYLGKKAGQAVGGEFGGDLGALGGGIVGGGLAAGLERNPATALQSRRGMPGSISPLPFGIQRFIPDFLVPKGELGTPTNPGPFADIPARMPKAVDVPAPQPELGTPENPGFHAKLPVRMPKANVPASTGKGITFTAERPETQGFVPRVSAPPAMDVRFVNQFEKPALPPATAPTSSVAGTRSLILTPSEAASEDVMQGIAKKRASERGMQFAGGMTPREGRSVPKLPSQMQEEEFPGPREVVHFPYDDDEPQ